LQPALSDHPLYASGRKYAAYRWRKPAPDQDASNPVQPEVTRYEKEEAACPSPKPDSSAFSITSLFFLPTKNFEIKN
jgi:hypothetical protein